MTKRTLCVPGSVAAVLALGALMSGVGFVSADARPHDAVIQAHRDRQQQLMESSQAILARAEQESRDLTEAEQTEIEGLNREFEDVDRQVALRERTLTNAGVLTAPRGRQADPDDVDPAGNGANGGRPVNIAPAAAPAGGRVEPQVRATARGTGGFRHFGEFASAVRAARSGGENVDARLRNAAMSTYGQEAVGADGGFAVPPDFRSEIMSRVYTEDSLITRTDRMQSSSNQISLPIDMTTPWQTTGGIQAYWQGEASTITQSKPALENVGVKLHKLSALVPVTEEMLEDAPSMDAYLRRKAPEKIDFKLSYGIAWGNGSGMPLGYMNSPALVTVAAEGAQAADTIVGANVVKMYARLPLSARRNAVWLIHPDAEAQLPLMTIGDTPAYIPPGGLRDNPFGTLLGRPVIPHQVCETVGDLGDIQLVDLSQYLTATKIGGGRDANGLKVDTSMHLWFDQDAVAFKFTLRVAGQPWWSAAIAQRDGSNTQSPFVTLAAR